MDDGTDWFASWAHDALDDLIAKQDRLAAEFRLGAWSRYDYDLATGAMVFSDEAGPKVQAEIQIVGSTSSEDWLWGWANGHLPPERVEDIYRVKAFGIEHEIAELSSARVEDEDLDQLGWDLTAIAVRVLDAPGAYRAPSEKGALFMVIRSIGYLS